LQLGDLPQQLLDPAMFLYRCLDLLREILGDVHRPCLAGLLEGQVTAAAGLPAETGRQRRAPGHQGPDARIAHAPEQGRVFGNLRGASFLTKYIHLVPEGKKMPSAKKKIRGGLDQGARCAAPALFPSVLPVLPQVRQIVIRHRWTRVWHP